MNIDSLGLIIATRVLEIDGLEKVKISLGAPQRLSEDEIEYLCPYQIIGLDDDGIKYAIGIDAFKALEYAMQRIGAILKTSDEARAGRLSWRFATHPGDFGYPPIPTS